MGSSVFPQNIGYNPLGLAGALTYWFRKGHSHGLFEKAGPLMQA